MQILRSVASARLARASIVMATLSAFLPGCRAPERKPVRNVVLISIDTLRADRLGTYGFSLPTSPELDAFAARGAVFENASSTAPWTQPAHASMLTGLYPAQAGMRRLRSALPTDVTSVAERMQRAGFLTVGCVNSTFLGAFQRGFDRWSYVTEDESAGGSASAINDLALAGIRSAAGERLFLFVHYFDVHTPYKSRPQFERPFLAGVELGRVERGPRFFFRVNHGQIQLTAQEIEALSQLYEAGIRQLDERLGILLRQVEKTLDWDSTLVIVTSDHGDAFLEHGMVSHGGQLYQEALHVPIILFGGGVPAGARIAAPVSLVDVAPTVLAAAGLPSPRDLPGIDLASYWMGSRTPPSDRPLIAQSAPALYGDSLRGLRRGRFKLIEDTEAGRRELYDLAVDPKETTDLSSLRPSLSAELGAALDGFMDRYPDDHRGPVEELDPEKAERLRSLGYLE